MKLILKIWKVIAGLLVVGFALLATLMWRFDQPPFDLAKLGDLRVGMTPEQVREVLGPPTSIFDDGWSYSGFLSWPIVYVYFDESGVLVSHRYDY